MRRIPYTKVFTTRTWSKADEMVGRLRQVGLHPADLCLTTPLTPPGARQIYPVEVPEEEEGLARQLVQSFDPSVN